MDILKACGLIHSVASDKAERARSDACRANVGEMRAIMTKNSENEGEKMLIAQGEDRPLLRRDAELDAATFRAVKGEITRAAAWKPPPNLTPNHPIALRSQPRPTDSTTR